MNQKKAKQLRKDAINLAAQMVQHGRTVSTERVYQNQNAYTETQVNRPDTLRGIYRYLKKNERQKSK